MLQDLSENDRYNSCAGRADVIIFTPRMKVPYTQQFSPQVTPLSRLLPILRTNAGKTGHLRTAIGSAFFNKSADPKKMAGNTLTALRYCGILGTGDKLTDLGKQLIDNQNNLDEAHKILARHFLLNLDGINIVETLREMTSAGIKIELKTLPKELRQRGFEVLDSSSDLSGFFGWLRQANVLKTYTINTSIYYPMVGTSAVTLEALKDLNGEQLHFLKSMAALNVQDWTPYNVIVKHAEELYSGEVQYNPKLIVKEILEPLETQGFIQIRKKAKQDTTTPTGRGGKPADVKPTDKFEREVADPLINVLYRAAGFTELRKIRSMALADIVADAKQTKDTHKQGKALEILAIRICQMLDLEFMGWRETDVALAGGGEVDAMLYSSRLIYSRWQIQCKIGKISAEAVMKEVGLQQVSLANVILIVSTSTATSGAQTYRNQIISTTNLNIIFLDGSALERIIKDNSAIVEIFRQQAEFAMNLKPDVAGLKSQTPTSSGGGSENGEPDTLPLPEVGEDPWLEKPEAPTLFSPVYSTGLGRMYNGDSLDVLRQPAGALRRDGP
jgi:site-specific DNA-methyltransferase (cytosine-N4-specific)